MILYNREETISTSSEIAGMIALRPIWRAFPDLNGQPVGQSAFTVLNCFKFQTTSESHLRIIACYVTGSSY